MKSHLNMGTYVTMVHTNLLCNDIFATCLHFATKKVRKDTSCPFRLSSGLARMNNNLLLANHIPIPWRMINEMNVFSWFLN